MIDFKISDLLGGEPIGEIDMPDVKDEVKAKTGNVFHVCMSGGKVLEKVVASNAHEAMEKAHDLLGEVDGLFVTGPHEFGVNASAPSKE